MSTRTGLRTHSCGELRASDVGSEVKLCGWVHRLRDHKGVLFADLRDRHGFTQVVFRPEDGGDLHQVGESLRPEDVVQIRGEVEKRPDGKINPKLPTGEVELRAKQVVILNRSETPPFEVRDSLSVSQELRLKHRYLDIRNPAVMEKFEFRHRLAHDLRQRLHGEGFLEIETPFLTKSTPEGARDYLVPSRVAPGSFYALPQSPQLFKQILMVSGVDRYFQFVRCFRDEDLRADRQPEFTQVDLEMSFVEEDDVIGLVEVVVAGAVGSALGIEIPTPFPRILYSRAMEKYGSDCPDLRFGMEICDITDLAAESPFQVFRNVAESGGKIKGISAPGAAGSLSRKEIDSLIPFATEAGAKGLAWAKVEKDGLTGPVAKHFPAEAGQALRERMGAEPGDLLLFVADEETVAAQALGALRVEMAKRLDMIPKKTFRFAWVTEFPLFEKDSEGRISARHHPFTAPAVEDLAILEERPLDVRARAYDLVLNGAEVGGGSIRIHARDVQKRVFATLGIDEAMAQEKFGFLLDALSYGAPPHGGIALGFDRLVTQCLELASIREVIAFPKTTAATCPLTGAPAGVEDVQLEELGLARTGPAPGQRG